MEYLVSAGVGALIGTILAFIIVRIAKREHAAELDIEMGRTRTVETQLSNLKEAYEKANLAHIATCKDLRENRDTWQKSAEENLTKILNRDNTIESFKRSERELNNTIVEQSATIKSLRETNAEQVTKINSLETALLEQGKSTKEVSGIPADAELPEYVEKIFDAVLNPQGAEEGGVWPEPVVYNNPKFQPEDLGKYEGDAQLVSPETSSSDSPQKPKSKPRARNRSRAKKK